MQPVTPAQSRNRTNPGSPPTPTKPKAQDVGGLVTDIVSGIPVHSQSASSAAKSAPSEDDELDQIMSDVGQELKSSHKSAPRRHLFARHRKNEANFSAQPLSRQSMSPKVPKPIASSPARETVPQSDPKPASRPSQAESAAAKPPAQADAKNAKPAKQRSSKPKKPLPLAVILLTILVTGALVTTAIEVYKG
ncbi:MAG TPA: hypothetical protein VFW90_00180 [Candidatus Saccharimonadales bacterium]|nr:hypothetical protein [Candidatus Saccharimonadales bacterium]